MVVKSFITFSTGINVKKTLFFVTDKEAEHV
jgi:hypothetical protein